MSVSVLSWVVIMKEICFDSNISIVLSSGMLCPVSLQEFINNSEERR